MNILDTLYDASKERIEGMGEAVVGTMLSQIKGNTVAQPAAPSAPAALPGAVPTPAATTTTQGRPAWVYPALAVVAVLVVGGIVYAVAVK